MAVEGKDGSGQTTLIDRLTDGLSGMNVRLSVGKEPTDGPFGSPIRAALTHRLKIDLNTLQLGFSADRSDDLNKEGGVIDLLKKGYLRLEDRWFWSTIAYAFASDLDVDYFMAMQSKFPIPDLTIYLDVPVDACLERMKESRLKFDLFETGERLEKVDKGYRSLLDKYPEQFRIIDGTLSPDLVYSRASTFIEAHEKYERCRIFDSGDSGDRVRP